MRRQLLLLPFALLLCHCGGGSPPSAGLPQIINVSGYDPKEKQRPGASYSEYDVSALRSNGAAGLIARCGKGGVLDTKCADFLAAADREGMLLGAYYRLQTHVDAEVQADQFVNRMRQIGQSRDWRASKFLLCADFDAKSRLTDIVRFLNRVEQQTGVVPVTYLENSEHLKLLLRGSDATTKARLRRSPYWLALYSHESGAGRIFPAPGNPAGLLEQYKVWHDWTLWQYAGVDWQKGRSVPKHYSHGRFRSASYFGNLDRPVERNVYNGSVGELKAFWNRHGMSIK